MGKVRYVVLAALLLAATLGVVNSQGASPKQPQGIVVVGFVKTTTLPASSDPRTAGVVQATVACPKRTHATGGGYSSSHVAFVPQAELFNDGYVVVAANVINKPGTLRVGVSCIRTSTRASAASASLSQTGTAREVESLRAERRIMQGQKLPPGH